MSKQDRVYTRTASDLERKYNFGKRFAEIMGIATDAQDTAKNALDAVSNLDNDLTQEEIFNILTNNGESQAIYREDGLIYINASFIKTGYISSDMIKAGVIRSLDYEVIEVDPIYPSDSLYPGTDVYPNNGEDMVRGLEIDFRAGVIRGFVGGQDNAEVDFRLAKAEFSITEMESRLDKLEDSPGVTIKKLWENASPGSSFAAQTIEVDLSPYEMYMVIFRQSTTYALHIAQIATVGHGLMVSMIWGDSGHYGHRSASCTTSGITFNSPYYDKSASNLYFIPNKIYGIKGVD